MKARRFIYLFLFFILFRVEAPANNGDKNNSEVIKFNNKTVTINEFTDRLNFTANGNDFANDSVKKENLAASIIAEKIFAEEARRMNFDTIPNIIITTREYEREAVYEVWMQKEISDRIHISEDELISAYPKFREQRVIDYLKFEDKASAEREYNIIKRNGLTEFEKSNSLQSKTLSFGESLLPLENCIYSLKKNEYSAVMAIDKEYYIFKLNEIVPHPINSKHDYIYWKESIEKILRQRKTFQNFEQVMPELMKDRNFTINKKNYEFVVEQLSKKLRFDNSENPGFPQAANMELAVIPQTMESHLDQPFIKFDNNEIWTIGDIWQKLRFGPYLLNYTSEEHFKNDFSNLLRRIVLVETVTNDGYKKNYNESEYVAQQKNMWSDDLLSKLYQYQINKKIMVSEDEMYKFYSANKLKFKLPEMCHILAIFVNDLNLAESLTLRIKSGEDIVILAKQYSRRTFDGRNIEDGIYIAKDTWGDLGKAAFSLNPGELSTPIKIDSDQFAIIKLIEKSGERIKAIDEVKNEIKAEILKQKSYSALSDSLNQLCDKYEISINRNVLMKTELIEGNMFLRKSHFPNRMVVPLTTGFNNSESWFRKYLK